jgi:erythromycin esterase-like protein
MVARPETIRPLAGLAADDEALVRRVAGGRFALLGEASHGTHEFYRERAEITKRLISVYGFNAVAVEADWPDAYRVNLFVRGETDDTSAEAALGDFRRFPAWMWRNADVVEFVDWLRGWNQSLPSGSSQAGFYGLDLYSLFTSMEAVIALLEQLDPDAAQRARRRYSCFDHVGRDPQIYAYETAFGGAEPCERQAVEQLVELRELAGRRAAGAQGASEDRLFYAEQNARLVANAEEYYRAVFYGGAESWNLRDRHMVETLEELVAHLERTSGATRVAVWAHNSHLGDARATQLGRRGELNVGQLVRERYGRDAFLVGLTTNSGTVTAASDWGGPAERKRVRPALSGSWERQFHESGISRFLVEPSELPGQQLERAIGVIYRPETERMSHYFDAQIADQFDAVIHFDETRALEPLERTSTWERGELPDTYPWAV